MARSQQALYDKKDLQTLIEKGAVEPLTGNDGSVRVLKARTTPDKTARCLAEAYQTIPEGGILLQPILFNYDENGNLTSYTNRKNNPDGTPNGKYDHGTLIAFQKGGNGQADRVTYVDSVGDKMPEGFRQKLEATFPGVQISEASTLQQPRGNKRDCGPNVVRNATVVVQALHDGRPIDPSIFTVPTAADISAQRMKDAGIIVTEEAQEQAKEAKKKGKDIPYYVPVTQQMVGSLQQMIQDENSPPGPMMQLMMGYIPNTPPQNGLPVTYTPKTLLAAIGLRFLGLAFGLDENVTSLPSWAGISPENSFAFRPNTFSQKLDREAFEGVSPLFSVFIEEVKASLKNDEAMKAERLAREKQEALKEARTHKEEAIIRAAEKNDPFAAAAAQARKAGLVHAPEDSGALGGTSSNVERLTAERSTTKTSHQL